jgi:6-phosphogluconolactonase/glucosamine-6-phosphate isomerase/deaminase
MVIVPLLLLTALCLSYFLIFLLFLFFEIGRTRLKTLAQDTIIANARFFNNDLSKVPKQALTVGVGTVMDAKEVLYC